MRIDFVVFVLIKIRKMLKIIVAGSRHFNDFLLMKSRLDFYLQRYPKNQIEIISGTAKGADLLGERYALISYLSVKRFPPQWNVFGKSAGYRRNEEMARYASHCVVFWNGKSSGTKHMIEIAKTMQLKLRIVRF